MWVWIVLVVLVVLVALWAVAQYNGFVRLRNIVEESWKQIDVELHRRYDLIPNLVETVKGYAAHERQTFENVTKARAAAVTPGSGPAEQAMQENMLTAALCGVLIPVILRTLRIDPALASSIFLTTITDVAGFFFFLGLAALLLGWLR